MPVHSPTQQVLRKIAIGKLADCINSTNRLYETVFGNK
jgi:hypothetical protein